MLKELKEKLNVISASRKMFKRRSILLRTTTLSWLVIIFTLEIFVFSIIPYQRKMLVNEMESRAEAVSSSIANVAAKSIVLGDYSAVIDHCVNVLKDNPGISYIVVTRNDGFSMIITHRGWKQDSLSGMWQPSLKSIIKGKFIDSRFTKEKVFHYTQLFEYYSGIKWGWIHIGLSLDKFSRDLRLLYWRIVWLALVCILIGLAISLIFSRQIIKPLFVLINASRRIKDGDLSARAEIHTGDELEVLADSFNLMTSTLLTSQKELVTTKEYTENIIRSVNDILIVTDKVLNIKLANTAAYELLGYREGELSDKPLAYVFTDSDYTEFVDSELSKLIKDGFIINREINYKTKEGNLIPTLFSGAVIRDKAGKLEGVVIIAKDITDRKRVERVLRDSEERYRMLFEQSPIGIGLASFEGRIISLNAAMLDMLGYSQAEIEKLNMADLYCYPGDRKKLIEEVFAHDSVSGFSTSLKHRGGTRVEVILNVSRINLMGKDLLQTTCLDITERRKAEEKVRESERKFRAIFDQTFQFIGLMTVEGILIEANRSSLEFSGIKESDVLGKPFWQTPWWRHSQELQNKLREATKSAAQGAFVRFEATHMESDGTIHDIDFSLKPIKDENGKVMLLIPEGRDITEHKKSENALRDSEEKIRTLLEHSPDVVLNIDREYKILFINRAKIGIVNAIGKSAIDFISPEYKGEFKESVDRVFATGEIDTCAMSGTGGEWYSSRLAPIKSEGKVTSVIIIATDDTERRKAEQALSASRERYRVLFEESPIALWEIDCSENIKYLEHLKSTGIKVEDFKKYFTENRKELLHYISMVKIIDANKASLNLYKVTSKEQLIKNLSSFMAEDTFRIFEGVFVNFNEFNKTALEFETIGITATGEKKNLVIRCSLAVGEEKTFSRLLLSLVDITERKIAEEALQKAYEDLRAAQNQLVNAEKLAVAGRLASGVAHEVKNPLAIMLQGLEYLSTTMKTKDKNINSTLLFMKDALQRANSIIKGVLDFSSAARLEFSLQNVEQLIENAILIFKHQFSSRNIEVLKDFQDDLPIVKIDKSRIEQVLLNIFTNALQSMPTGGRLIIKGYTQKLTEVGYSVGLRKDDVFRPGEEIMIIEIENTGPSIPEGDLDKLFEPFFTTKRDLGGTGLGLAISKNIMEMHQGSIKLDNIKDSGVRVTLIFKVDKKRNS